MRRFLGIALALVLTIALSAFPAASQEGQPGIDELKKSALKVFLDCDSCDLAYIKTEITFVNYVRDRLEAQVHVLVTTQATGGGGREYTLTFIGQNDCRDLSDVQKYFSIEDRHRRRRPPRPGQGPETGPHELCRPDADLLPHRRRLLPARHGRTRPRPLGLLGLQPLRQRLFLGRGDLHEPDGRCLLLGQPGNAGI